MIPITANDRAPEIRPNANERESNALRFLRRLELPVALSTIAAVALDLALKWWLYLDHSVFQENCAKNSEVCYPAFAAKDTVSWLVMIGASLAFAAGILIKFRKAN